jgi:hypothetical protein
VCDRWKCDEVRQTFHCSLGCTLLSETELLNKKSRLWITGVYPLVGGKIVCHKLEATFLPSAALTASVCTRMYCDTHIFGE